MISRIVITIVFLSGAFFAFGHFAGNSPEAQARRRDADVIDACKAQMRDELLPAATRAAAGSVCNGLRNEYVRKYGREP